MMASEKTQEVRLARCRACGMRGEMAHLAGCPYCGEERDFDEAVSYVPASVLREMEQFYRSQYAGGYQAATDAREAAEAREAKLREAIASALAAMKQQMASDDALDAPYNEDMAQAIASCYSALGEEDEARKWYEPKGKA